MTPEQIVTAYALAWTERDRAKRLAILKGCFASDGVDLDPSGRADGREGLCEHIAGFQQRLVDHRLDLASGIDEHDGPGPDRAQLLDLLS